MNRRGFLKIAALGAGALTIPHPDIAWPPGVRTEFWIDSNLPWYALTVDDGWNGASIEPFLIFAYENDLTPFTWFANGVGVHRIRDSKYGMEILNATRIEVGYHTMHHPTVEDQRKNYNRARWIEDYDQWLEIAQDTFSDNTSKVVPYARAAGGYFSDPFLEMCDIRGLKPIGWSKDPYVLSRGDEIERGDIFLTHFRHSEWRWFEHLRDHRLRCYTVTDMFYFEEVFIENLIKRILGSRKKIVRP